MSSNGKDRMRKRISFLLFASIILFLQGALNAQPRLKVLEGTKIDFGRMDRGAVVQKKVSLKNVGNQVLVIGDVAASCGCTGTVVSEHQIQPGETGSVLITFNSKNFSGPIHKTVTINSNAAKEPQTVIEFTGLVVEEISVIPTQVMFRDAEVGKPAAQKVKIKNEGADKLTLTGYRTQLAGLTAILPEKPIAPHDSVEITVEFRPKEAKSILSDLLYITTSSKKQPEVMIYVFGSAREFKFQ